MAAPADESEMTGRLIVGVVLIVFAIVFLALAARGIEYGNLKVKKIHKVTDVQKENAEKNLANQIICKKCKNVVNLTDYMKEQDVIYCENCGNEIKLDKDGIDW
ncbi:MAG: hypothetical protein GF364_01505 [Candidatus Lokiarchaeota archaeon]|nr:hypothetical protein [Candidatus Lokiarchaeota archaeon]